MTNKPELLPCPFCKSTPRISHGSVFCMGLDKDSPHNFISMTEQAWNTRDSGWQPIETAPLKGKKIFALEYADDVEVGNKDRNKHAQIVRYGNWSSIYKATHWKPYPIQSQRVPDDERKYF